jgi:hypothetical protein
MASTVNYYFNFSFTHPAYGKTFCRVSVPPGDDSRERARALMEAKFGKEWGFQYTQEEFDRFPNGPVWTGEETVVDIDELPYVPAS